jgi:archaellum component FlaF (FlaF/FlaG flagellin family)
VYYYVTTTTGFKKREDAEAFAEKQSTSLPDQRVCILHRTPDADPLLVTVATYENGERVMHTRVHHDEDE